MSDANAGTQPADSRLSVKDWPSRIIGRIAELRRRNSRLVIDSAAISHDSTRVIPPANKVASDRVAWATESCTKSFPASGTFNIQRSIVSRPAGVRDQRNVATAEMMTKG